MKKLVSLAIVAFAFISVGNVFAAKDVNDTTPSTVASDSTVTTTAPTSADTTSTSTCCPSDSTAAQK